MSQLLDHIAEAFAVDGTLCCITAFKAGHINETYLSEWQTPRGLRRFIHQRINHHVFQDVPVLMRNVVAVTSHLQLMKRQGLLAPGDEALEVIPTKSGSSFLTDDAGNFWRTYPYIQDSETFDICPDAERAYETAHTFGRFLGYLTSIDVSSLAEPIPRFQDTAYRFEQFEAAQKKDEAGRLGEVSREVEFAQSHRATGMLIMDSLRSGAVPLRASHSDPKVNNVLFNKKTKKGFCVVDLDTCMPGTILYDFGDLVRSTSVPAAEDEIDTSKVFMSPQYYEALARGFMKSFGRFLTARERELMPFAPRIIALTLGVRFLTDYLNGDIYFRIHRPQQNLDRCRAQFQIVRSMEQQEEFMRRAVV